MERRSLASVPIYACEKFVKGFFHTAIFVGAILFYSGCAVGPNYVRPSANVPADYKEAPENWKTAQPSDAITKGKWWEVYQDTQLNELEEQINVSNQSLRAAQEQFAQARATLRITRSGLFPTVTANPEPGAPINLQTSRSSTNRRKRRITTISRFRWMFPTKLIYGGGCAARWRLAARKRKQPARTWPTSA